MTIVPHTKAFDNWVGLWRVAGTSLLLLLTLIAKVHGQDFSYATNNGTIIITGYTGPGGAVTIPDTINGLSVTSIGGSAFWGNFTLTSITIPYGVTSIAYDAFRDCHVLTNVTLPSSLTSIGRYAFGSDIGLPSVTIPAGVTSIGDVAFADCYTLQAITVVSANSFYSSLDGVLFNKNGSVLIQYPAGKPGGYTIPSTVTSIAQKAFIRSYSGFTSITIPNSVTNIGDSAFFDCVWLTSVYFQGNPPSFDGTNVFSNNNVITIYYLPGTLGWSSTLLGLPTAQWRLPYPLILTTSAGTNRFGFTASWATTLSVVVEAATDLGKPVWSPLATNAFIGGSFYFSDPQWTNYPSRFYRVRSP